MNINKLIDAAKEIDLLAIKQEEKTKALQDLAKFAKSPDATPEEIKRRQALIDPVSVIDFSSAIAMLRRALHSK